MKRTGEKALSIISVVLNVLSVGLLILMLIGSKMVVNDPQINMEIENSLAESGFTQQEIVESIDIMGDFITFFSTIGWVFVVLGMISIILAIVGALKVNGNPKLTGILFIIGGVLSGIISLPGILLLIAAIMCFVRKPKTAAPTEIRDENGYIIE